MTVQIKDMTLDKVAIGPVAARVYQGAEYSKSPPVLIYFHGGAFQAPSRMKASLRISLPKPAPLS